MTTVKITPTDNGPLLIEGPARVVDADGNEYNLTDQTTIFLCRCGSSGTKPFCDGTHETRKFEAANRAPHTGTDRHHILKQDARTIRPSDHHKPAGCEHTSSTPHPAGLIKTQRAAATS